MKEKTLLSRKKIATILVATLVVVLLSGCSIIQKMEEEERLEEAREREEAKKEKLSGKLEEIYLFYLEGNQSLEEFDDFLDKNFGDKERILSCLKRQKIYNDARKEEYEQAKKTLEEALDDGQISKKEFEMKKDELWNKYLEDKNQIYDYLTEEEISILESCEEEFNILYESVKATKGT